MIGSNALGRALSPHWRKLLTNYAILLGLQERIYAHNCIILLHLTLWCIIFILSRNNEYLYLHFTVVESYERTTRHTFVPMTITAGISLLLLLLLVALYKQLAPRSSQSTISSSNASSESTEDGTENAPEPSPKCDIMA